MWRNAACFRQEDPEDILAGHRVGEEALPGVAGKAETMRVTKGSENVFLDCGFPPAEAENLRIRAKMMMALIGYIQERKITQSRAAKVMGVSQPRISDLVRGKIGRFTIDTLVNMVTAAGLKVDVDITAARPGTKNKRVA
jgi:predicted XRE-type DNA-binding protein